MAEQKLRVHFGDYLGKAEVVIYSVLAVLLFTTKGGSWSAEGASIFRASMTELGLLGLLILILVFSSTLLRRFAPAPKDMES